MALVNPRWVSEGMKVFAPWALFCPPEARAQAHEHRTGVRCTVAVAAGHHARIVNETRGIDRWMHINDLYVAPDDVHAR